MDFKTHAATHITHIQTWIEQSGGSEVRRTYNSVLLI